MNPIDYLKDQETLSLEQLKDLLRFPSVSAQSKHKDDMRECARWIEDNLKELGIQSEIIETEGHPIVYGEYINSNQLPTILVYGHYDVQPPEPIDLWTSSPFDPVEKNGYLYARGAVDDKGQIYAHIKGAEAYLKTEGSIPVNIKFLIEGEEETATNHLESFIKNNKKKMKADIALISDGAQYGPDLPAINYGLRGIAVVEVKVTGPSKDLHSGSFGGSIANPINILCGIIGQLQDENGRITIDGFYDHVITPSEWDKSHFDKLPFNKEKYLDSTGSIKLWGEKGFSTLEQIWTRPTLDCNGISGGYQGEGAKTIIPSWSSAKITMRLVPNQNPTDICDKFEAFLKKICPDNVLLTVTKFDGCNSVEVPTNSPWLEASARAIQRGFGKKPLFTKEGGGIPVVDIFKTELNIDTLLIGFGQHNDNAHSPNERFLIKDFHRGCLTSAALFDELSKVKS